MNTSQIKPLPQLQVDPDILFYAFRYALGRKTYAVATVVEEMTSNWTELPLRHRVKMQEEIRTAIKEERAGAQMDIQEWQKILQLDPAQKKGDTTPVPKNSPGYIPVNIWDDYLDQEDGGDGNTYAYVESSDFSLDEEQKALELLRNHLSNFVDAGIVLKMHLHDPLEGQEEEIKKQLIQKHGETIWKPQWKLLFQGLSHETREKWVEELNNAKLKFNDIPFQIYSES